MSRFAMMVSGLLAVVSVACGGGTDIASPAPEATQVHDPVVNEAAALKTFHVARTVSFTGSAGMLGASCDAGHSIYLGECVVNEGTLTTSVPDGKNGWRCEATPDVEVKGAEIVMWLTCVR